MELILIDDVFELGKRGDLVRVADGYGRNYLIPKKLAIPASSGNLKMVEQQRIALAKKEAKYKEEAELLSQELNQLHVIVSRKSGDTGTLFGSVTSKDIAELLERGGIHLDRRKIVLAQPLKVIGNYRVEIRPHSDVPAELLVSVLAEGDEPVVRIKKKDDESEQIVSQIEAKLKEVEQLTGTAAAAESTEEPEATEEAEQQAGEAEGKGKRRSRGKARKAKAEERASEEEQE